MENLEHNTARDIFLSETLAKSDHVKRQAIFRELFSQYDLIDLLDYSLSQKYQDLTERGQMNDRAGIYAIQTTEIIQCLIEDIDLLSRISPEDWDEGILKDAIRIVEIHSHFLTNEVMLKEICQDPQTREKTFKSSQNIHNWGAAGECLEETQEKLKDRVATFIGHYKTKPALYSESESTAPVTTLRELIVFNQVFKIRHSDSHPGNSAAIIDNILSIVDSLQREIRMTQLPDRVPQPDRQLYAWRPRTIVVVHDFKTGLTFTGATQPACDDYRFWRNLTGLITRHRLGDKFAADIDESSKDFRQHADDIIKKNRDKFNNLYASKCKPDPETTIDDIPITTPKEVSELHAAMIQRLPISGNATSNLMADPNIVCVAFDGFSFLPKAPCIRCQWMYSGWDHNKPPSTDEDRRFSLRNGTKLADSKKSVSYCAETVAASKLMLLRFGKLCLVSSNRNMEYVPT